MNYKILIIDDDDTMHVILDKLLGEDYELSHAKDAQEGIDLASKKAFNLMLVDIHMPGATGLDFLESLKDDTEKEEVPVLIMTGQPTEEKAETAENLGAADFINKTEFIQDKEKMLERVQMKLVTNVEVPTLKSTTFNKKELVSKLMSEVISGDFISSSRKLFMELRKSFTIDFISFWTFNERKPNLILSLGTDSLHSYGPAELEEEFCISHIFNERKPYYTNNVYRDDLGVFKEISKEEGLPSEIGVPLFALSDKQLVKNNMKIPSGTEIFGLVILKRNQLFTSKEFKVISKLLIQSGTILWRLFQRI